jgi:enolase-phosphatase E1
VLAIDEASIGVLLLDIEGTTTPTDFVYRVLFPFASRCLDSFLRQNFHDPEMRALIEALKAQQKADLEQGLGPPKPSGGSEESELRSVVAYTQWLIPRDSKCGSLKALQGKIWQEGYESGELRGQVYSDVPRAFERWRRQGRRIWIYSSGSVLAQQLLFRTTTFGDLTGLIEAFFDTNIGTKADAESYRRIAASVGCPGKAVLFLSDAIKELDAARAAGMQTALCVRSERDEFSPLHHPAIRTFDEVFP